MKSEAHSVEAVEMAADIRAHHGNHAFTVVRARLHEVVRQGPADQIDLLVEVCLLLLESERLQKVVAQNSTAPPRGSSD